MHSLCGHWLSFLWVPPLFFFFFHLAFSQTRRSLNLQYCSVATAEVRVHSHAFIRQLLFILDCSTHPWSISSNAVLSKEESRTILSLWHDSTWNWTLVTKAMGKHFNHYANGRLYIYIYIYIYTHTHTYTHTIHTCIYFLAIPKPQPNWL